jgi:hypothetical protein
MGRNCCWISWHAPRVRLLITSRHVLNVRAEWQFPLKV